MINGRHDIPNQVLASLQAIPGMYAGGTEVAQWCKLKGKSVLVVDEDGDIQLYDKEGGKTEVSQNQLRATMKNADVTLYKTPNHYQRIERMHWPMFTGGL